MRRPHLDWKGSGRYEWKTRWALPTDGRASRSSRTVVVIVTTVADETHDAAEAGDAK